MATATFNKNELITDKIRSVALHDLSDGKLLLRLTSLEDSSLKCTADGEEVTDAVGALITTMYRSKQAEFSASNSLYSFDLNALQYGATKELATSESKITTTTYEILTVASGKVILAHTPKNPVKYIYSVIGGEIGTSYVATSSSADETQFVISDKTITVPTSLANGSKVYVEYEYETEKAMKMVNKASNFPPAVSARIFAYFRDKCNENIVYSGVILCPKAKIDPSQIETALTSSGKHAFSLKFMKDYCSEEDELFTVIVSAE